MIPAYLSELIQQPRLVPSYGCKSFTPDTDCGDIHHGPIRRDSRIYCEVCGESGCDHWPCMKRDPKTEPRPEKRPAYRPGSLRGGR